MTGSSPRVRGTHNRTRHHQQPYRFIPAGAGNTIVLLRSLVSRTVHPRGCGEHSDNTSGLKGADGSSPRVRGTRPIEVDGDRWQRFIPAGAGNTHGSDWGWQKLPVHPRGCGEHRNPLHDDLVTRGSSPRVRGTPPAPFGWTPCPRFIPAGAGNTDVRHPQSCGLPVHPRGCGEHLPPNPIIVSDSGSSPRVRGTLHITASIVARVRFIPAGAGNTRPGQ